MKVISVVGARPQFVKLAPIAAAFASTRHAHKIIHTGQHYHSVLSDVFFSGLNIPTPDYHLGVGSGSHGIQTGAMLAALDPIFQQEKPDWVLVYGDTNSTLAATVSAVKMHFQVAHLEAGLRSFNRRMPEEHNRVLTDHAADLLLAPTAQAQTHLISENLGGRTVVVGDVMADVVLKMRDAVVKDGRQPAGLPSGLDPGTPYVVATLHRPDNTDDAQRLAALLDAIADLGIQVALLAHPRLVARANEFGLSLQRGSILVGSPLDYRDLVAAVLGSVGVVTDSGGLQKEAFLLDRVATTIRTETEWVETLRSDWNVLCAEPHLMPRERWRELVLRGSPVSKDDAPYGTGDAAERVVRALEDALNV